MVFFSDWTGIGRVVVAAILVYAFVVTFVRIVGKRAASRMNNYDWIVTVAIGSVCGAANMQRDLPLAEGLAGIATLLVAQALLTWLGSSFAIARRLMHAPCTPLYVYGRFLDENLHRERVSRKEVESAVRGTGLGSLECVAAVMLESSGKLAVIPIESASALDLVDAPGHSGSGAIRPVAGRSEPS
ncbi:MAG: DUF421 domain-containing protein [Planctomycetes bacterium]|nr:DUF421 domain-containing protein [Planctomycetota bacterium]